MKMTLSLAPHQGQPDYDSLGPVTVPQDAYYGAQTARAIENFAVSGITIAHHRPLIQALAMVKQAAASANHQLGLLSQDRYQAIQAAAQDVIDGKLDQHFPVDVYQGGAGTSTNMNMNEVIARRGLERLGQGRSDWEALHPNDHVNLSQSTNDAYPTAVRLSILISARSLTAALNGLALAFEAQAVRHASVVKLGRTQLQDAVPMTLGQELGAYATTIREDIQRLADANPLLCEVNLGGTAIGTGINAPPGYSALAIAELALLSGFPLSQSANLLEASWDMGGFVLFSGVLKRIAVKLSKIANDLRLLSSGPRGGFGEIALQPMQPGSSIMPGKVNPVIPEMLNQICFQIIGNDLTVTLAAEGGQLQLNAFEPLIAHTILSSIALLSNGIIGFTEKCVATLTARPALCRRHVENSIATVTALVPYIGYEQAADLALQALATGQTVRALAAGVTDLSDAELERILDPGRLAGSIRALP